MRRWRRRRIEGRSVLLNCSLIRPRVSSHPNRLLLQVQVFCLKLLLKLRPPIVSWAVLAAVPTRGVGPDHQVQHSQWTTRSLCLPVRQHHSACRRLLVQYRLQLQHYQVGHSCLCLTQVPPPTPSPRLCPVRLRPPTPSPRPCPVRLRPPTPSPRPCPVRLRPPTPSPRPCPVRLRPPLLMQTQVAVLMRSTP